MITIRHGAGTTTLNHPAAVVPVDLTIRIEAGKPT